MSDYKQEEDIQPLQEQDEQLQLGQQQLQQQQQQQQHEEHSEPQQELVQMHGSLLPTGKKRSSSSCTPSSMCAKCLKVEEGVAVPKCGAGRNPIIIPDGELLPSIIFNSRDVKTF